MNGVVTVEQGLKIGRIIVGAMIAGLLVFAAFAAALGPLPTKVEDPSKLERPLLLVLVILAAGYLLTYPLLRRSMLRTLRTKHLQAADGQEPYDQLIGPFNTITIIGSAAAEGFGLFAIVIALLTGPLAAWAGVALALLALAVQFPRKARYLAFVSAVTGRPVYR
jgi:small-conductance mechanosensitive channel